jgi:hypothetical protein
VPVLPRFREREQHAEDLRKLASILIEVGEEAPAASSASATAAGDPARLRGLPAIGRNVTGATVDTNPLGALLAKERRQGR